MLPGIYLVPGTSTWYATDELVQNRSTKYEVKLLLYTTAAGTLPTADSSTRTTTAVYCCRIPGITLLGELKYERTEYCCLLCAAAVACNITWETEV